MGLQLGLPSATLSVPTTFLLLEEMYLGEDIIWTRKKNTAFLQSANDTFPFEHLRISKSLKSIVCQTILINFVCNILDWLCDM